MLLSRFTAACFLSRKSLNKKARCVALRRKHNGVPNLPAIQTLYKAAQSWSALYHPNVLPFLGVSLDLGLSPALITPLCPSGPIMKYLKMSAQDPTERLQMVSDLTAVPCVCLIPDRLSVSLKDWSTFTPKGSSMVIYAQCVDSLRVDRRLFSL